MLYWGDSKFFVNSKHCKNAGITTYLYAFLMMLLIATSPIYGIFSDTTSLVSGLAKGNAITADFNGLESMVKNPAAVMTIDRSQFYTSYLNQYLSAAHQSRFSWGRPLTKHVTIAFSVPVHYVSGIPETVNDNGQARQVGTLMDYSATPMMVIGTRFQSLSVGLSLQYNFQKLASQTAHGVSLGLGTRYVMNQLTIGASVQNLVSQREWGTGRTETYSPSYHVGVSSILPVGTVLADIDMDSETSNWDVNLGYTVSLHSLLDVHMGIKDITEDRQYGAGMSLNLMGTQIHYTYTQHSTLGQQHTMGVTL